MGARGFGKIEVIVQARSITPLKLVDVLVLIGATAVSFAVVRAAQHGLRAHHYFAVYRWIASTAPCVLIWMWAVLGLRLFRPRPPLWRLARQPGILACLITLFAFGLSCVHAGALAYSTNAAVWSTLPVEIAGGISGEILIAWLTLAITGQWRPTPDWFDRAGRALGTYMVVLFWFVPLVATYLNKFF
jgi:hypothetical protein